MPEGVGAGVRLMTRMPSNVLGRAVAALAIAAALAAAACGGGGSSADSARNDACEAKTDIDAQVAKMQGLPASPASVGSAKSALEQIHSDLATIRESIPDVTGDLKDQLRAANSAFTSQVSQITQDVTSAQSATDAAGTISAAGEHLSAQYRQSFAAVKC
ncbi:hypothetical protein [Gaiella sp.]|uniref:hypothetical protein n=1 Tax=Gaiella sp. TaxID=2663207 RepID=UPI002E3217E9|nr:hypothetical protein [Gaiella sp.]HEX5584750.1 hypothetical protein [Gaiella sp.]